MSSINLFSLSRPKRHRYKLPFGVSYHVGGRKFVGRIYRNGEQVWLGSFKTAEEAAKAVESAKIANSVVDIRKDFEIKPNPEDVAALAYQLYVDRGYVDGFAEQDWLEAESILSGFKRVIIVKNN